MVSLSGWAVHALRSCHNMLKEEWHTRGDCGAAGGVGCAVTEAPDGFRITAYDPDFERQMASAGRVMRARRNMLRELAK